MTQPSVHPSRIWPGQPLTPQLLERQWDLEFRHQSSGLGLATLVFGDSDWMDWEWNAREALVLNARWPRHPGWFRHWFLPQNRINLHLARAIEKLLQAWQQWVHLPAVQTLADFPSAAECAFVMMSAHSHYTEAQARRESLHRKGILVQHFSVRQRRYYQHMAGIFRELQPLADAAPAPRGPSIADVKPDILWHTRELAALLGGLDRRPGLPERIRLRRLEVNRLLAANCLYHCRFLKNLAGFQDV